jgi:hypothetical protein
MNSPFILVQGDYKGWGGDSKPKVGHLGERDEAAVPMKSRK